MDGLIGLSLEMSMGFPSSFYFLFLVTITADLVGAPSSSAENLILPNDEDLRMDRAIIDEGETASFQNQTKPYLSTRPIFVIISFDGFRYDYFTKAETPNLNLIKKQGVSAPYMKPQFPTKTFPNHHSLATGLHPDSHGVIDNNLVDPLFNMTLGVKNEEFWVYDDDVVPLYVLNEWTGGVSGVMMWPGSPYGYGHNKTKPTYVVDYNRSVSFESRVDTVLTWLTNATNPANLIFMYCDQPDESGHAFGPESPEVKSYIGQMDNVTGYMIKKLRDLQILDQVNLIFLSDHGFEEVTQNHIVNISTLVNPARYSYTGGSPTYHIHPSQGEDVDKLYLDFKSASEGLNFSVYKKEKIDDAKPHWYYSSNRRIAPVVLVAHNGYVFDDFYEKIAHYDIKYNMTHTNTSMYGNHGYDNHFIHMQAFFRAMGPAFRSGIEIEPFENIDLFPFLCRLLHIQTPPNNGTIQPLTNSLVREGLKGYFPIGWIIGGGVLISLVILFVISTLLVTKKRRQNRYSTAESDGESSVGYRHIINGTTEGSTGRDDLRFDDNRSGGLMPFRGMERRSAEQAALLNSDESLSSTENMAL